MNLYAHLWIEYVQPVLIHWSVSICVIFMFAWILEALCYKGAKIQTEHLIWSTTIYAIALTPVLTILSYLITHQFFLPMMFWRQYQMICAVLFYIFAIGAGASFSIFILMHRDLIRIIKNHQLVEDKRILEILKQEKTRSGISSNILLYHSETLPIPCVSAFWTYRMFFPTEYIEDYLEQDFRAMLVHELTHIKNGDVTKNKILIFLKFILWFHPLIYILSSRFSLACEKYSEVRSKNLCVG
ncbi:MAG: hypothetical protein GC154_17000 [bacterium]|nr:hypothetical protein [bacterium]